ncbi:MAG TPA: hypothetical protein VGX21_15925 [Methylomirabilota bacterium]|jgi:hypothetical protein|nr:hypothetical protein [Methylomirabilota bacterium]
MSSKRYAVVSGVFFTLISLLQFVRALNQWPAQIGSWQVPVLLSWVAGVVTAAFAVWAFRVSRQ